MRDMKLTLRNLTKQFGAVTAVNHIDLDIEEGKLVSFLGPSGCGKTTTLRMVAGLENPTDGQIIVDGKVLSDQHHSVLPEKREIGMMFQSYAVWPHMTVWDNVAYGLKIKKIPKAQLIERTSEMLDMVGMLTLKNRYPTQLSGGQQQRVALSRALANHPKILLLDEPLCNLDTKLREDMRFEIRRLQQKLGITAIYVTHSQDEALAVSDELVIMRDGRILQRGAPEEIYLSPKSAFVAEFIGLINNFEVHVVSMEPHVYIVEMVNGMRVRVDNKGGSWNVGAKVRLLIRPESIRLEFGGDERVNRIPITIDKISFTGNIVNYFVNIQGIDEIFRIQNIPPVCCREGDRGYAHFPETYCSLTNE